MKDGHRSPPSDHSEAHDVFSHCGGFAERDDGVFWPKALEQSV